jgi:PAS domain S-box-containing protein
MSESMRPKILIVDDEEAILETMSFTFMDPYDVLTTSDPKQALQILEENAPVAVIITDQRMPGMSGVELLRQTCERFPETIRIILTGFADAEATIQAINDGRIYGYVNKPWEPAELKALVKRAVEHHGLTRENHRLLESLRETNLFLAAVMDRLRTGAIALDRDGVVRAVNRPARAFIGLGDEALVGRPIDAILGREHLEELAARVRALADDSGGSFEEVDIPRGPGHRLRVSNQALADENGERMGRVILFKEISHEPLTRDFEEILARITAPGHSGPGQLRPALEQAVEWLRALAERVASAGVESANMSELEARVSRTRTAISSWLDVDEAMVGEAYPDAQLLRDRMNIASQRWPRSTPLPEAVSELARAVEDYYESGENHRQRIL